MSWVMHKYISFLNNISIGVWIIQHMLNTISFLDKCIIHIFILFTDPSCTGGSVRLSEGMEGYVETCYSGRWYGVCTHSWDFKDAFVVCRELGYPATGSSSAGGVGEGGGVIGGRGKGGQCSISTQY